MMKRLILAAAIGAASLLSGQPAECIWCPIYTCYAPCGNCLCLVPPGGTGGACVGVNESTGLIESGWKEIR